MALLHVEAEGTARASAEAVWSLIADADSYSRWGPWDASGYQAGGTGAPTAAGSVRWLRAGRRTTVEEVVEIEEPKRLVYTVIKGIPVRNYRGEVTLAPTPSGTHVRWAASWERTLGGRFVRLALRRFYPRMMAQLLSAAEQHGSRSGVQD